MDHLPGEPGGGQHGVRVVQEEGGEEDEEDEEREHLESSFPHGRSFCFPEVGGSPGMGWRKPRLIGEELPRKNTEIEAQWQARTRQGRPGSFRASRRPLLQVDGQQAMPDITRDAQRLSGPLVVGLALLACNLSFQEIKWPVSSAIFKQPIMSLDEALIET